MKKLLAILLAAMMLLLLPACGLAELAEELGGIAPDGTQSAPDIAVDSATDAPPAVTNTRAEEETQSEDAAVPTEGLPLGWPENEHTALVPKPNCGGKVLTSGEIGTLFAIELKWSMEQGLVYAQQLAEAGFGEDCAEKYEKYGYIDRTANGVNVQLLDAFGTASVSIMPVE